MNIELRAKIMKSGDLPGHQFVRLEFTDNYTGEVINIMENHLKPRYVATWIAKQIRFISKLS